MKRYYEHRLTLIAPHVDNDGAPVRYAADIHNALIAAGYNFTTYQTTGVWKGNTEPGTLFELYVTDTHEQHIETLAKLARSIMTDQEAIQITYDPIPTTVYEA